MCYAKVLKNNLDTSRSKKKKKKIGTHEGPKVLKKIHEHMKAHKNKKNEMIAMSQKWKARERSLIRKEYSKDLEMFYPHTCTSWSKGMTSFSSDPSFDLTKYVV